MRRKSTKSMKLSQTLTQILSNYNSTYDAAQEVSLQTGESLGTVHKRISQWLKKDPETWVKINQTLNSLGYQIEVKKMPIAIYSDNRFLNFSRTARLATKQEFLESDRCSGSVFEALEPGESIQLAEGVFTLDEDLDIPAAPTW